MMRSWNSARTRTFRYVIAILSLTLTFGITRLYAYRFQHVLPKDKLLRNFPSNIKEWKGGPDNDFTDTVINTLKVDEYVNRDYFKDNMVVSLYIGYYHSHQNFVEIHTPENCQENAGWNVFDKKLKTIHVKDISGNKSMQFIEATYGKNSRKYLMLYFYKLIDETTTSFFKYKFMLVRNSIIRNRTDAAFIRIILPVNDNNPSESILLGEQFLRDILPTLFHELP
jgi:EpsI family protein